MALLVGEYDIRLGYWKGQVDITHKREEEKPTAINKNKQLFTLTVK